MEFRFVDVPDSDFTLQAFGIPEQVARPAKVAARGRELGYWFFGLSIAALVLAVTAKSASSRLGRGEGGRTGSQN
jgi:hypothetical protein